jgi:hypothetical protein
MVAEASRLPIEEWQMVNVVYELHSSTKTIGELESDEPTAINNFQSTVHDP